MQLIYRAQTFNHQPKSGQPYHRPRALNWRYQVSGETYNQFIEKNAYHQPRALNWRYRLIQL